MALFLPRRWRRQPQFPVRFRQELNVAAGAIQAAVLARDIPRNVSPVLYGYATPPTLSYTPYGIGVTSGAGTQKQVAAYPAPWLTDVFTWVVYASVPNTSGTFALLDTDDYVDGTSNDRRHTQFRTDATGVLNAYRFNDAKSPFNANVSGVVASAAHVFAMRSSGSSFDVWLNKLKSSAGTITGTPTGSSYVPARGITVVGSQSGGSPELEGGDAVNCGATVYGWLGLNYWASDGLLTELADNFWSAFEPQRRVLYFLGTAGVNAGVGATSGTSTVAALSGSVAASTGTTTAAAISGYVARSDGIASASATSGSVAASSGTSTVAALAGALGEATGIATVSGLSGAIGQSAGIGTAAAVSASAEGAGEAAGTSAVTGVAGSIGQAAGTSAADASSSSSAAVGESAGTSTAAAIAGSIGQASGTGTASGITGAAVGVGESAGTSNVIALSGSIGSAAGTSAAAASQGSIGTSSGTATVLAFHGAFAASAGSADASAISGSVGECAGTTAAYAYSSASVAIGTADGTSNVIAISGVMAAAAGSAVAIAYSAGPPGDLPAFRSGAAGTRPTVAERRRPAARSRYGTA